MRIRSALSMLTLPILVACSSSGAPTEGSQNAQALGNGAAGIQAEVPHGEGDEDEDGRSSTLRHIFYIMMENHGTAEIIGNTADAPYVNELASKYAVASNYFGVTHPSLPNYLAAISGSFQGIWDDCAAGPSVTCDPEEFVPGSGDATSALLLSPAQFATAAATPHWFSGTNLVDQLESNHRSWKAYMQSIPSVGSTVEYAPVLDGGAVVKLYAQKHDPFMYFSDIRNTPERLEKIVPFTEFGPDLEGDTPDFVWVSPDQCHDMHGVSPRSALAIGLPSCGYPASGLDHGAIALGDTFLKETVEAIMASRAWRENSAIVIAWDEDDYAGFAGCCESPTTPDGGVLGGSNAPAIVITSKHARHRVSTAPYNHYSLLGTIQHLWHLGCLGETCDFKPSELMTPLFRP